MNIFHILLFAVVQGLAELLPVSSSAHVILAQHLLGYNPSQPEMTFLLVMLHTGTMFAVLFYFWPKWKRKFLDKGVFKDYVRQLVIATAATGILGFGLKMMIEKIFLEKILKYEKGEIEQLFSMLPLISASLFVGGALILFSGIKKSRSQQLEGMNTPTTSNRESLLIGLAQGLVLPFRGLSRSGTTISVGLLLGQGRELCEEFSFALAVILTPPVIFREFKRFLVAKPPDMSISAMLVPSLIGVVFSFAAGMLALKWLSRWLETGKWYFFGIYCLAFSAVVAGVSYFG